MHLRSLLVSALAALLAHSAVGQDFRWAQSHAYRYRFNPELIQTVSAACPDGGAWWVAPETHTTFYGSVELGTKRLLRLRADGTISHQQVIGGNLSVIDAEALPDGGVLLLGDYKDSLRFDAQHHYHNPHFNSGEIFFLAQLDVSGAVRWIHELQVPRAQIEVGEAKQIVLDAQGEAWVAYCTFGDSYATRFRSSTGDSLTSIIQQNVSRISSVAVAPDGTVYTASSCANGTPHFNGTPVTVPPAFSYNIEVACYNPGGALRWVQFVDHGTCPAVWVATADTSGVYFAGSAMAGTSFGPFPSAASIQGAGTFLTRLDRATGTFQWLREAPVGAFGSYTDPAPNSPLAVDGAGNAWLLTTTYGTSTWSNSQTVTAPAGGGVQLLAYDQVGNLRAVTCSAVQEASSQHLTLDPVTNRGILTGLTRRGGTRFLPLGALPVIAADTLLPFAVSFQATLAPLGAGSAAAALSGITVSPNPVAAGSSIALSGLPVASPLILTLHDALGRTVSQTRVTSTEASFPLAATLTPGLYVVRLQGSTGSVSRPVVVQ